jgi:guanylate kinase
MQESLAQKLKDYKTAPEAIELIKQTNIMLLVGPTGAGKDSLKQKLLSTGLYHEIVSHTTRPPRINHGVLEKDGQDYHFIDLSVAEKMLDEKAFVEAKIYSGNLYGTSVAEIKAAHDHGKVAVTDIEVQGVAEYKAIDVNVMAVFLVPPSFEIWQARLQRRYGDVVDAADYRLRLSTALSEIEQLLSTDHYMAMINDDLEVACNEVHEIVTAHKHDVDKEHAAREVAEQLTKDIREYLKTNV